MKTLRLMNVFWRSRLRHPIGWVTVLFAPALLLTMALVFDRSVSVASYATLPPMLVGAVLVPYHLLTLRETGVLQRLRLIPLRPARILGAKLMVDFLLCCLGSAATLSCGWLALHSTPNGNWFAIAGGVAGTAAAYAAAGLLLASVYRSRRAANILSSIVLVMLVATSGVFEIPNVAYLNYSPSWQAAALHRGLWDGRPITDLLVPVYVLSGMFAAGGLLGAKMFRWRR